VMNYFSSIFVTYLDVCRVCYSWPTRIRQQKRIACFGVTLRPATFRTTTVTMIYYCECFAVNYINVISRLVPVMSQLYLNYYKPWRNCSFLFICETYIIWHFVNVPQFTLTVVRYCDAKPRRICGNININ